jgi:hypothetical protein
MTIFEKRLRVLQLEREIIFLCSIRNPTEQSIQLHDEIKTEMRQLEAELDEFDKGKVHG